MVLKHPAKKIAGRNSKSRLAKLIEQATIDCYNDSEAKTGFLTMIEDNLAMLFTTNVLGAEVEVISVDLQDDESLFAVCRRGKPVGQHDQYPTPAMPRIATSPA